MSSAKELLISTRPFAQENRLLSWWHLLSTVAVQVASVAVACSNLPWVVRIPAGVVAGLTLVRFFILYHDHQHHAILYKSPVADFIMTVFGLFFLNPPSVWKRSHDHHHVNNSRNFGVNTGSYPIMTVEAYRSASLRERIAYRLARNPLTIAFGYVTIFFIGMCVVPLLANPKRHYDAGLAILVHGAFLVWLAFRDISDLCFAALLPFSVASALGAYLFYAQHNFPGVKLRTGRDWDYVRAALESSSYAKMGPIMRWFTGSIGYHHVHHLNSRIPFYRLAETMAAIPELQSPKITTLHPRDVIACLRLKLWDMDGDQLVPWSFARNEARTETRAAA